MIYSRKPEEIEIIREGGRIAALILEEMLAAAKPGIKSIELENLAASLLDKFQVKASFKTVRGYPFALCLSLNEEIVHGLPSDRRLCAGDLLSVDFGALYHGFHSDMARTIIVQNSKFKIQNSKLEELEKFLLVGKEALFEATAQVKVGNRVGNISQAIQRVVERGGFSPAEGLVGHGVGRKLHEDPQIPCFLIGKIEDTPVLKEGMVLAIEVMYARGDGGIKINGWTAATADGSLSAHFENTVAVTKEGPVVLTL